MLTVIVLLFAVLLVVAARLNRYATRSRRKRQAKWKKIVDDIRHDDLEN